MIRISSSNASESGLGTLQQRQRELSNLQEQMTSGKRVARASDDPVAAARAERALARHSRSVADQRSLEASRNAITQAESALGAGGDLLLRVRELLVQASNPTYSDVERGYIGDAIRGLRRDLLDIANRDDGAGGYVFGGQGVARPPFLDTPAGVTFSGAAGQQQSAGAEPLPMSLDGRAVWLQAPNATTGALDLSIFTVLDRVATELTTAGRSPAAIALGASDGLRDVDAVSGNLSLHRARSGETLIRTDSVEVRLSDQALAASVERSAAEDLDMVQAISDFQNKQTGYDAALKTYAMVQRLSLFQYIGN